MELEAFERYFIYVQDGVMRTDAIKKVCKEIGKSEPTLWRWYKKYGWKEREAIRTAEIYKRIEKRTNTTITENKVQYLSFYHKLLNNLDANIKIRNVNDLVKVIDACMTLQGKSTENVNIELQILDELKQEISGKTANELIRMISDERTQRRLKGSV